MSERTREERLEHNLRGLVGAHIAAKRKLGEPVDEDFLRRLLEEDNAMANELDLGWGERRVRVRGLPALIAVGLLVAIAALLWINYQGFAALAKQEEGRVKAIAVATEARQQQAAAASAEHRQLGETLEAVIYVLTLGDEQKRALRLRTPDKIRDLERR